MGNPAEEICGQRKDSPTDNKEKSAAVTKQLVEKKSDTPNSSELSGFQRAALRHCH
jgi:hypothetical protein